MMRILVVTQYYAPEPGATQNRMLAFVQGLVDRGHQVTVVCEQPNHPAGVFHPGYGRRPIVSERLGGVVVHRLWVATSTSKTARTRVAFYGSFAAAAFAVITALPRHDVVFSTSPPLPGALTAAAAAKIRRTPFVLDVRDIWPAAAEALGEITNPRLLSLLGRAERWLYRASAAVTATTRPFCTHIDRIAGAGTSVHLPNGALDTLVARPPSPRATTGPFTVGYVGNLGIAQGLNILLDAAEALRAEDVRFTVVGDGPISAQLRGEIELRRLDAITMRSSVPTAEVGSVLEGCDALLIPLSAHPVLADFIPSKLYDAMAVGRPAIVAANGEAAALVEESGAGIVVPPEDGVALAATIRSLAADRPMAAALGAAGKRAARDLARSVQVGRLAEVLTGAAARSERPRGK